MSADKAVIGARLRKAREASPRWSREELARLLRCAADERERRSLPGVKSLAHMIKEWEAGKHDVSARYRRLYSLVLGTTEEELFAPEPARPARTPLWTPQLAAANGASPGDYAAMVRDTNSNLIVLDSRYGGTSIADVAAQAFSAGRSALATGRHDADEIDLQAAVGETGEIAAWCLYDGDRLAESRAVTHEAMLISRLAGDRDMELFQLSHLALVDVHQRHSREALRIAEHIIDPGGLAPRVEALFRIRAARALAQGGYRQRAIETLDEAAGALEDSVHPRDPAWTWWLDESELAWHRGILHMELGEYRKAMPYLDAAAHGRLLRDPYNPATLAGPVTARGEEWGRAAYNDLVHLLLALTMVDAWQDTEAIMGTVADFTAEVVSARTEVMLRDATAKVMGAAADGRGRPSSTLVDLAEQVAAARGWPIGPG